MIDAIPGEVAQGGVPTRQPARTGGQPAFAEWLAPGAPRQSTGGPGQSGNRNPPPPSVDAALPQVPVSPSIDGALLQTPVRSPQTAGDPSAFAPAPRFEEALPSDLPAIGTTGARSRCFEVVASPWKLVATGLARMHVLGTEVVTGLHGRGAEGKSPATAMVIVPAMARRWTMDGAASRSATGPLAAAMGTRPLPSVRAGASDAEPARAAANVLAEAAAASPFAARLLRQFDSRDGRTTLWMRDFRLGDAHAATLVPLLRDAAVEAGVAIGRIVVNGRTLWHDPLHSEGKAHAG